MRAMQSTGDDRKFANWDPAKDDTDADYEAR